MTRKKKEPVTEDDPTQSEAFRKAVRAMETAGDLNRTAADETFERVVRNAGTKVTDEPKQ